MIYLFGRIYQNKRAGEIWLSFIMQKVMDMDVAELIAYLLTPVAQVALIIGMAEMAKRIGVQKKIIPIIDMVLGLISGICVYGIALKYGIFNGILLGIALGLSACGLFSGIKNLMEIQESDGE